MHSIALWISNIVRYLKKIIINADDERIVKSPIAKTQTHFDQA